MSGQFILTARHLGLESTLRPRGRPRESQLLDLSRFIRSFYPSA